MKEYPVPNKWGVFGPDQCEVLEIELEHYSWAKISLLEYAENSWTCGISINTPLAGIGCGPSLSLPPCSTRSDALFLAVKWMEEWCERSIKRTDNTNAEIEVLNKILAWLETHKQLKLF